MAMRNKRTPDPVTDSMLGFYRRARAVLRSSVSTQAIRVAALAQLADAHYCAAAAIRAAIDHADEGTEEALLHVYAEEIRLATAVGVLVAEQGGAVPRSGQCTAELPYEPRSMSFAGSQSRLMAYVRGDLEHVAALHQRTVSTPQLSDALRRRLQRTCRPQEHLGAGDG